MDGRVFIITIDTEGDNIWSRSDSKVTTENARYLPRFQDLCEKYGFKPTYLVNYEMANDQFFQEFGKSVIAGKMGEIGLHVHPWNSPPIEDSENFLHHPYLYEYSDEQLYLKLQMMTECLQDIFGISPKSHRAGRWGFDERVARALVSLEYSVDCSVTPGVSFKKHKGRSDGDGGPDFYGFPNQPYFLNLNDISKSGDSKLLEIPVTIMPNYSSLFEKIHHRIEAMNWIILGRGMRYYFGPPVTWLRPNGKNLDAMLSTVDWAIGQGHPVLEFMLHSSEFMAGGSPIFKTSEQIEILYQHLEILFKKINSLTITGCTLSEYRDSIELSKMN